MQKLAKEGCWSTIIKILKNGLTYKLNLSFGKTLQKNLAP